MATNTNKSIVADAAAAVLVANPAPTVTTDPRSATFAELFAQAQLALSIASELGKNKNATYAEPSRANTNSDKAKLLGEYTTNLVKMLNKLGCVSHTPAPLNETHPSKVLTLPVSLGQSHDQ